MKALLALICSAASLVLHGATLTVTDSISEALGRAEEGDTIIIPGPQVYRERLVIAKPVRLVGANSPVVDSGGSGTTVLVAAPGVELRGLVLRNSGQDLAGYDSGIRIEADKALVTGCRVENEGFGIYIRAASNCDLSGNEIVGNGAAMGVRGNGIHLWKTRGNTILRNVVSTKRDGIYLSYADKNRLEGNIVKRSRFGIHYMYSHYNELAGNKLLANAVGATLMFARHCVIRGNHVTGNTRHGMLLKQVESSIISGNVISGQNRGLFVQQAVQDRFEHNLIFENQIGIYLSSGSEQNVFVRNSLISNIDQVWQPPDEMDRGAAASNLFHEKGEGNYWSDYTGADQNQDGRGDTPYYETDLYGYLLDRHPEVRLFAFSPAVALLRSGEKHLPLLNTRGVADLFPLTKPPMEQLSAHLASQIP